ncbi:hypothetical protein, partial [Micromonospora sp. I033]
RLPWSALPGLALFVVLALCGLTALAGGVSDREPVPIVGGAFLLLLFGSLVGLLLVASSTGSGSATTLVPWPGGGTRAVRFGYRIAAYGWFGAVVAACVLLALGLAVVAVSVWGGVGGWVAAAVLAGGAALLGWHLVVMLRLAPGGLLLSPAGIAHAGLTSFYSVPWAAVHTVDATRLGTSVLVVKAEPSPRSVLRRHTGRFDTGELRFLPFLVVRTYWLAADREAVRSALAFYLAHPELREELATPAAVRRIVEGRTGA